MTEAAVPGPVLAVDTSTDVVVGLARGDTVLAEHRNEDPRRHVEDLMPAIRSTLTTAGIEPTELGLLVVGLGPGPFTGLRVGIATARMLALTLGVPLRGVCALDAIAADWCAAGEPPTSEFLVVTDARRREVYWSRHAADGRRLDGPSVSRPDTLPPLPLAGPGSVLCPDHRLGPGAPERLAPGRLALAGPALPVMGAEPLYLRRPDAEVPAGRKSVLARRVVRR